MGTVEFAGMDQCSRMIGPAWQVADGFVFVQVAQPAILSIQHDDATAQFGDDQPVTANSKGAGAGQEVGAKDPQIVQ